MIKSKSNKKRAFVFVQKNLRLHLRLFPAICGKYFFVSIITYLYNVRIKILLLFVLISTNSNSQGVNNLWLMGYECCVPNFSGMNIDLVQVRLICLWLIEA